MDDLSNPSLKQIAKRANVSIGTVSRILKRTDINRFSKDTISRVGDIAKNMGYRPNLLVQGFQTGKTKTVGVMVPPYSSYWAEILYGLHDELIESDHVPIVIWLPHREHENRPRDIMEQLYRLIDRRIDGVIISPLFTPLHEQFKKEFLGRRIPIVTIDQQLSNLDLDGTDSVLSDEQKVGELAAKYLLSLGHQNIGHLAGYKWSTWGTLRCESFVKTVESMKGATCKVVEESKMQDGLVAAHKMLGINPRPTAVFVAHDVWAASLYKVAKELAIRIPHDLSVIGCGNNEFCKYLEPALTSIEQYPYEKGRNAARLLIKHVQAVDALLKPQHIKITCKIALRDSTAPP